ncbi:hypothetical protein DB30_07479 [Enhygromyxa salina]|uniref:Uncharacterized protein n=1 Tax=Enhygromyxa salina TaxID=215803 RepID=A0A0C2CRQ8_9BACT|nr:hypothetical protein [Enhygromyxa salina]KIG13876.1 hypothetical protein DB30_07479 [Enhygromyxa salina]
MGECVFKWFKDGDLMVAVNTAGNISDEVWDGFIAELSAEDFSHYIGCSLGILEVSAAQRKQAALALRSNKVSVAIVTDDVLVRGVVTAVSWLGANVKSFAWKDFDRALERHGIEDRKQTTMPQIERLCTEAIAEAEARKRKRRELLQR